jgi:hypothetical protein
MSAGQHADELAAQAIATIRGILTEADERAAEIIREAEAKAASIREQAEAEASQIRERAEADARGQIEAAKRALDELGGTLAAAASSALPPKAEAEPQPAEPQPAEQQPGPERAEPQQEPADAPGAPEAPVSPPNGDDAAERLVAMKLAVEGKDRITIEAELAKKFGSRDRSALLDDVLSRVAG